MEFLVFLLLLSSFLWIFFYLFRANSLYRRSSRLPPGPFPIPIIGNLLQLRTRPLISLEKLGKIYGPLMYLKLGSQQTIIASSPEIAREVLMKHDLICSGRPIVYGSEAMNHHEFSVATLPVGSKWRTLRRICKEHIFAMQKMEETENLRQEKLQQMRIYLEECSNSGRVVEIGEVIAVTSLNLLSATLFSMDFASYNSTIETQEMRKILNGIKEASHELNISDYFPFLKWFDPKGLKRKIELVYAKLLGMLDEIISERLQSRDISSDYSRKNDLLEVLLDLNKENDSELSLNDIKHLLMDLIFAGAGTTSEIVQWIMVELLRDPEKMSKVKNELRNVVGENKQVVESDIPKLSYLNAVIREVFRYHPLSPPLSPHKAEADVEINGYTIPKGATILVNVLAIYRDSKIWPNPNSFEPERFLNNDIDYKGQHFEFIPFGSGRRMCPGIPLAHLMTHLMVAHMIHSFEFRLEGGKIPQDLDTNEIDWILLHKTTPLKAIPVRQ